MAGESAFGTQLLMHLIPPLAIIVADDIGDEFEIDGDWTAVFTDTVTFRVVGSTANDGNYSCDGDSTYAPHPGTERTTITVHEALGDDTHDGDIERCPAIASVVSISGPSLSLDTADVTAHDSTGAWEEHVPTILRSGDVSFDVNFDPADDTHITGEGLLEYITERDLRVFDLVLPNGDEILFSGYVTGHEPSAPHDGALTASVTIKPTGAVTLP